MAGDIPGDRHRIFAVLVFLPVKLYNCGVHSFDSTSCIFAD